MNQTKIKLNITVLIFFTILFGCTKKQEVDKITKKNNDSLSIGNKYPFSKNDILKKAAVGLAPSWFFYQDDLELLIADKLSASTIYYLTNAEGPNPSNLSSVYVKRDNVLLNIDSKPAAIYEGGAAIIEGKTISLLHAYNLKVNSGGQYFATDYSSTSSIISGRWRIISDNQPVLLADLKAPRHFRIIIGAIDPNPNLVKGKYRFSIIVDDKALPLELVNSTSVDTYGSRIGVVLKSAPTTADKQFKVDGTFQSW